MSSPLILSKISKLQGEMALPGDKSISHRSLFLTSIGKGTARITNFLNGQDCLATAKAFQAMGVAIDFKSETDVVVTGNGKYALKKPKSSLDMGNSGTTTRLLMGILAAQEFSVKLIGDESLSKRPMKRIVEPLTQMGASFSGPSNAEHLPIEVHGAALNGMHHYLKVASAQLKSALLLAGLYADGETAVTEPEQSRDHTERMFRYLGVKFLKEDLTYRIESSQEPQNRDIYIPGDISSAAFFLVAASALPKSSLIIKNIGLNPTRSSVLDVLKRMGAQISVLLKKDSEEFEPVGDIEVFGGPLQATEISGKEIPNLIDELPVLAVAGALAEGTTVIRDAAELRVKESDRIAVMANALKILGVQVEEFEDGLAVTGPTQFKGGATFETHGDHRIAMSLAIAGLFCEKEITILNPECILTSFPNFKKLIDSLS